MGERVAGPVLVVLGRDPRQRIALVAVFLEIEIGDMAEDPGETLRFCIIYFIGCAGMVCDSFGGSGEKAEHYLHHGR
jgi:hypothetical protein